MKKLLMTTGILELVVGLGMLAAPSLGASLLLGSAIDSDVGLVIARFAGVAVFALAVACWLARGVESARATRGLISAMVLFNGGALFVLLYANLGLGLSGVASWPAAITHAAMGMWCVGVLMANPHEGPSAAVT